MRNPKFHVLSQNGRTKYVFDFSKLLGESLGEEIKNTIKHTTAPKSSLITLTAVTTPKKIPLYTSPAIMISAGTHLSS